MTTSSTENFTVKRRYLTEREVERLIEAAKSNRHGHRDASQSHRINIARYVAYFLAGLLGLLAGLVVWLFAPWLLG
jgi:hypothetical protein